jgi:hypothetical protein
MKAGLITEPPVSRDTGIRLPNLRTDCPLYLLSQKGSFLRHTSSHLKCCGTSTTTVPGLW